jgi:streptogramin lyase
MLQLEPESVHPFFNTAERQSWGLRDSLEATVRIQFAHISILLPVALAGCAASGPFSPGSSIPAAAIHGTVHGGNSALAGAHIYMLQANTNGYGQPSISLLQGATTGNADNVGAYVLSDASGNFSIPGAFTCNSSAQVYLYAAGGKAGANSSFNSGAGLLAAIGYCPPTSTDTPPNYALNEVSTVAAAFALAGFATDATHISAPSSALAQQGIENAFANAALLYNTYSGTTVETTPAGNGALPYRTINTLANILASCVDSSGSTSAACSTLFANARSNSGAAPVDTAAAALNIAHNPGANVAQLCKLAASSAPYGPALVTQPNDFTLGINFTGGGLNGPSAAAIDAEGNAWFANLGNNTITKLNPQGKPLSPDAGYSNGTPIGPVGIAIDLQGDPWIVNAVTSSLTKYVPSGALLSPISGYSGGGLAVPQAIATDSLGNIWVANYFSSVSKFSNGGVPISTSGYTGGGVAGPVAIALDASGGVWVTNTKGSPSSVSKLTSAGQAISPPTGFTGGGLKAPFSIAIDNSGSAWVANFANSSITKLSPSGDPLSPSTGFTGGGLSLPFSIAVDGGGNAWVANNGAFSVSEFSNNGTPLSPDTGYQGGLLNGPQAVAIDGSGNVWIANSADISVTELVGAGVPVVTPLATGVKNNQLGVRP